jgi:hypothetical protein
MNSAYSYRSEDFAFVKVLLVAIAALGLLLGAVLYVFDETIIIGEVCCVTGANDARLGHGILVKVVIPDQKPVLVSWQRGVAIIPGRDAEILQIKNGLTGGKTYSLVKYVSTDS